MEISSLYLNGSSNSHERNVQEPSGFAAKKIGYEEHWWNIHADLKVTAIMTGLQGKYTKFLGVAIPLCI
jgi:uncharacterized membrane protein